MVRLSRRRAFALIVVTSALASVLVLVAEHSAYQSEAPAPPRTSSPNVGPCSEMWDCTSSNALTTRTPTQTTSTPTQTSSRPTPLGLMPTSTTSTPTSPNSSIAPADSYDVITGLLHLLLLVAAVAIIVMLVRPMTNRRGGVRSEHASAERASSAPTQAPPT